MTNSFLQCAVNMSMCYLWLFLYLQRLYREKGENMKHNYTLSGELPEMVQAKLNAMNLSDVRPPARRHPSNTQSAQQLVGFLCAFCIPLHLYNRCIYFQSSYKESWTKIRDGGYKLRLDAIPFQSAKASAGILSDVSLDFNPFVVSCRFHHRVPRTQKTYCIISCLTLVCEQNLGFVVSYDGAIIPRLGQCWCNLQFRCRVTSKWQFWQVCDKILGGLIDNVKQSILFSTHLSKLVSVKRKKRNQVMYMRLKTAHQYIFGEIGLLTWLFTMMQQ